MQISLPKRRVSGFTLKEVVIVMGVLAVIGAVFLLGTRRAPPKANRMKCVNNLKNIGVAFRLFAVDHQDRYPMEFWMDQPGSMDLVSGATSAENLVALTNQLNTPKLLLCPADQKRKPATAFTLVRQINVSYFVGLGATEEQPQSLLAGDRNLTTNGIPVRPGMLQLTAKSVVGWSSEMHLLQGNVLLGDGSVQQSSGPRLMDQVRFGPTVERLAVP